MLTELERQVKAMLSDRVEQAERPVAMVNKIESLVRQRRRRRRNVSGALGAPALVIAVVLALVLLAGNSPAPAPWNGPAISPDRTSIPLVDTAATPAGWVPVAFGSAQISVPPAWLLESANGISCGPQTQGMVFVARQIRVQTFRAMGCRLAPNVVSIGPAPRGPAPRPGPTTEVVNGIRVTVASAAPQSGRYLVPQLGVQVTARGPLARRVLVTFARSPLSVALASGPAFPAPPSWPWYSSGGVRFAAPASWSEMNSTAYNCWPYLQAAAVTLLTSRNMNMSCPAPLDTTGFWAGQLGVEVDSGQAAASLGVQIEALPCLRLHGLRACISQQPGSLGWLTLSAFPAGASRPTIVRIGLAGSGVVSREILDSIGPA
jgi:hypothetical protein